jgi:hypothetical protein
VAKRAIGRSSPSRASVATLTRRFDELESVVFANRRSLELQFKRMADIQAEIDQITARLNRDAK